MFGGECGVFSDLNNAEQFSCFLRFQLLDFKFDVFGLVLGSGGLQFKVERHHSCCLRCSCGRLILGSLGMSTEGIEITWKKVSYEGGVVDHHAHFCRFRTSSLNWLMVPSRS